MKSTLTSSLEILSPRHGVVECCPEVLEVEPEYHQQGTLEGGYNNHSSPSCLVLASRLTQEEGGGEDARPEPAAPCLTSAHHGNMTATLRGREHKCSDREGRERRTQATTRWTIRVWPVTVTVTVNTTTSCSDQTCQLNQNSTIRAKKNWNDISNKYLIALIISNT